MLAYIFWYLFKKLNIIVKDHYKEKLKKKKKGTMQNMIKATC